LPIDGLFVLLLEVLAPCQVLILQRLPLRW
jgi:hypothetical protein